MNSNEPPPSERTATIKNEKGLHARAATMLRECASRYKADITVVKNHMEANAKSLLGLIALGAAKGETLKLIAKGEEAELALDSLVGLIDNLFEEKK